MRDEEELETERAAKCNKKKKTDLAKAVKWSVHRQVVTDRLLEVKEAETGQISSWGVHVCSKPERVSGGRRYGHWPQGTTISINRRLLSTAIAPIQSPFSPILSTLPDSLPIGLLHPVLSLSALTFLHYVFICWGGMTLTAHWLFGFSPPCNAFSQYSLTWWYQ